MALNFSVQREMRGMPALGGVGVDVIWGVVYDLSVIKSLGWR
jgi:hypothetical protein